MIQRCLKQYIHFVFNIIVIMLLEYISYLIFFIYGVVPFYIYSFHDHCLLFSLLYMLGFKAHLFIIFDHLFTNSSKKFNSVFSTILVKKKSKKSFSKTTMIPPLYNLFYFCIY